MTTHAPSVAAVVRGSPEPEFVAAPLPCIDYNEVTIRTAVEWEEARNKLPQGESPTDASTLFCSFPDAPDAGLPLFEFKGEDYDLFDKLYAEAQAAPLAEPAMGVECMWSAAAVARSPTAASAAAESAAAEDPASELTAAEFTAAASVDAVRPLADAESSAAECTKSASANSTAAKSAAAESSAAKSAAAESAAVESAAAAESPAAEPAAAESTRAEAPTATSALAFVPHPSFQHDINKHWGGICDNFFTRLEAFPAVLRKLKPLLRCPPLAYTIKNAPKDVLVFLYRHDGKRLYCHDQNTVGSMASDDDWPIIFKGKPTYMSAVVEDCENSVQALGSTAKAHGFASAVCAAQPPPPPATKARKPPPPATKAQKPPPPATKAQKPPPPPPAPAAKASRKRKAGEGFGSAVPAAAQPKTTEAAGERQRQSEGPPCMQAATNTVLVHPNMVLGKRERKLWKPSHI
jgi:hypothetical protein